MESFVGQTEYASPGAPPIPKGKAAEPVTVYYRVDLPSQSQLQSPRSTVVTYVIINLVALIALQYYLRRLLKIWSAS